MGVSASVVVSLRLLVRRHGGICEAGDGVGLLLTSSGASGCGLPSSCRLSLSCCEAFGGVVGGVVGCVLCVVVVVVGGRLWEASRCAEPVMWPVFVAP